MLFGALFFALAAQVGCTKEALDHYKNEGIVEIDLTQADGSPREGNFRVHFYPVAPAAEVAAEDGTAQGGVVPEGSDPVYQHFDFEGSSFRGKLPVGSYKVLIHNTDTENLALQDEENYDKATFYVTSSAGRSGECLAQPKNLFVANCAYTESEEGEKEQLATLDVAYRGHIKVKSEPKPYVKTVVLYFSVEGDELVELTGGTFIGVSPAHHCASATCAMSSESVEFDTQRIFEPDSDYTYKAEITALDLITPSSAFGTHMVVLNIVPKTGTPYKIEVDVTEFIDDFLREHSGAIPVDISVEIPVRLERVGEILSATVVPWVPGTGSGTVGEEESTDEEDNA